MPNDKNYYLIENKIPWHIPYSQLYAERLISKALELCSSTKFDYIEGNYLYPYSFAAFVVSKLLDIPLVIHHAGSDVFRVGNHSSLNELTFVMAKHAYRL